MRARFRAAAAVSQEQHEFEPDNAIGQNKGRCDLCGNKRNHPEHIGAPVAPGPTVADEPAADRLMRSLDYRLSSVIEPLTPEQVAVVLHALADHTALQAALAYRRDIASPWPEATSLGRWLHEVGDQLEER